MAEDYIEAECLSSVWMANEEVTKTAVWYQLAEILVQLAETTFDSIGALMLDHILGPTVECMELFKDRTKGLGCNRILFIVPILG